MSRLSPRLPGLPWGQARDLLHRLAGSQLLALGLEPRVVLARPPRRPAPSPAAGEPLGPLVAPFVERIASQRVRVLMARCGCYAFAVAALCALLRLASGGAVSAAVSVALLVVILAGGAVLCAFQRPGISEVARLLDRQLDLHELLGTAVELEEGIHPSGTATSPVARLQHRQACAALRSASPTWVLPRPILRRDVRLLVALGSVWLILLVTGSARVGTAPGAGGGAAAGGGGLRSRSSAAALAAAANPFAHFSGSLRTVARSAAVPGARLLPGDRAHPAGPSSARPVAGKGGSGARAAGSGSARAQGQTLTRAGGAAALGRAATLSASQGAGQGASGGMQRASSGAAPSVGDTRRTDPGSSSNMGNASPGQNSAGNNGSAGGSSRDGKSGGMPGSMPGGADAGSSASSNGKNGKGSTGEGTPRGGGGHTGGGTGGAGRRPASQGAAGKGTSRGASPGTPRGGGSGTRQPQGLPGRSGRMSTTAAEQGADAQYARALQRAHDGQQGAFDPSPGAAQQRSGGGGQRMPGTGGSSHIAGVHDLLPNLGNENVSQNGLAFVISGHRAQGAATDVGRANTFEPTGAPGGMIVANAPVSGAAQPGAFVAPDGNEVAPDQQALVKAYFSQDTGSH